MRSPGGAAGRVGYLAGVAACTLVAAVAFARLEALDTHPDAGAQLLYLPEGRHLRVASLGFHELLADLVYLWSIQYYAEYDDADVRYQYLDQVYSGVIAELDPYYLDPYLIGALIMAIDASRVDLALELLDLGFRNNPDEWILLFEAGMYCYDARRYDDAADYFERALEVPGAHPSLGRLAADMHRRRGDLATAYRSWLEIYGSADSEFVRNVARNHVHDLSMDLDLRRLAAAVERFRDGTGRLPWSLAELVTVGLIDELPIDADGRPYLYDPADGSLRGQSLYWLRRNEYPSVPGPSRETPDDP